MGAGRSRHGSGKNRVFSSLFFFSCLHFQRYFGTFSVKRKMEEKRNVLETE